MNEIAELMTLAAEHDAAARECRKAAGRLLIQLRENVPAFMLADMVKLDDRTVDLLIKLAAGGTVRHE